MMLSHAWLSDWLSECVTVEAVESELTNAGLEVDNVQAKPPLPDAVVVGEIIAVTPHPKADRLQVCEVLVSAEPNVASLSIVCGCPSVKKSLKVAVATVGCVLPNGLLIEPRKLRGVASAGMLCSAEELGMMAHSSGILHLDDSAQIGQPIATYFDQQQDHVFEVAITPNRGDCLSVMGLARELSCLTGVASERPFTDSVYQNKFNNLSLDLQVPALVSTYALVRLDGVDVNCPTPHWILDRLKICQQTSVNIVVDILNYVMFELGQPMHAFDADTIHGKLQVRLAETDENIELLNEQTLTLNADDLIISDESRPVALAGIMGGHDSAVSNTTNNVVLESACFSAEKVATMCRRYALNSESAFRFERGVDPSISRLAMQRALTLLIKYAGGKIVGDMGFNQPSEQSEITLPYHDIQKLLGFSPSVKVVAEMLHRLACKANYHEPTNVWSVTVPSYRYDLRTKADLIEEILRLSGLDRCPASLQNFQPNPSSISEHVGAIHQLRKTLVKFGLTEHVGYSFVSETQQKLIMGEQQVAVLISNPLSNQMNVLRQSCWPGLLALAQYNFSRQKDTVRVFELGQCFAQVDDQVQSYQVLSGLLGGQVLPLQWSEKPRLIDFFDVKGLIESTLVSMNITKKLSFVPCKDIDTLHPGQAASVFLDECCIGYCGVLHPRLRRKLKLSHPVCLFELKTQALQSITKPKATVVSKFPAVRRDLSVIVPKSIMFSQVRTVLESFMQKHLKQWFLFDIYDGDQLGNDEKSYTIALWFQSQHQTLTDTEVNDVFQALVCELNTKTNAIIRE